MKVVRLALGVMGRATLAVWFSLLAVGFSGCGPTLYEQWQVKAQAYRSELASWQAEWDREWPRYERIKQHPAYASFDRKLHTALAVIEVKGPEVREIIMQAFALGLTPEEREVLEAARRVLTTLVELDTRGKALDRQSQELKAELQSLQEQEERRRAALIIMGLGLQGAAQSLRPPPPPPSLQLNCTTQYIHGTAYTHCY